MNANLTDRPWLKSYPPGVPADIDATQYPSLVALMEEGFGKYSERTAYSFMGKNVSFGQTDQMSQALAAYLQSLGLAKGDRVAVMMPNCPQYPVAVAAILRAGYVVVNVNPLYTPRELEYQLKDSGSKAIVIIENFAATLEACIANTMWCAMSKNWCPRLTCRRPFASTMRWPWAARLRLRGPASCQTTWPCCSTPAAPPACPRARCCCTAT